MTVLIGTSGYVYPAWRKRFYPEGLPQKQELSFASRVFSSIEINRSFYSLLRPSTCLAWREQVPSGFVFALKGSRFITHNKKLRDVDTALANFFASGPLALAEQLGPIVWQLPASMRFDEPRLQGFLEKLPKTMRAAGELARAHDQRIKHGAHTDVEIDRPLRHVLEPRHESFFTPECALLLRHFNVALAVSDSPTWPYVEEPTADFMYLRLHGSQKLYASQYTDAELVRWAEHVRAFSRGSVPSDARRISTLKPKRTMRDVYVYFDNDAQAYAAQDAQRLMALLTPGETKAARRVRSTRPRAQPVAQASARR